MPSPLHRSSSLTQSHLECPPFLQEHPETLFRRYGLSGQQVELDQSIPCLSEERQETSLPLAGPGPNTIHTYWDLTLILLHRSKKSGDLEDVNITISRLRNISHYSPETAKIPQYEVTTAIIEMLAARAKVDVRNALKDIDEIVVLCPKLLASNAPQDHLTRAFEALTQAVLDDFSHGKQLRCLNQAIGCLRDALIGCPPGFHHISLELSNLLVVRFLELQIDEDYQEAKTLLSNIILPPLPSFPRAPSDTYQIQASTLDSTLALARLIVYSNREDWDGVVSRCRSFLEHCSLFGNPLHPVIMELLTSHSERLLKQYSPSQGAQTAHSEVDHLPLSLQSRLFGDGSEVVQMVPLTVVEEKIKYLRRLRSKTLPGTERQKKCLNDLVYYYDYKISLTQDVTAIEEAIRYRRMLLLTTHPSDPSMFFHHSSFAKFLYSAFGCTERVQYLDESITRHHEVLRLDSARQVHFVIIQRLIEALSIRWSRLGSRLDLDEAMRLFASGIEDTYTTVPSRFELACRWAYTARIFRHKSVLAAYMSAMSLMQESLVFAPTLHIQHDRLVEKRELYEKTPLNFASYHIRAGQVERAIEVLEEGRALIWSEMRGLRTSTDRLRTADSVLAEKFTAVNHKLEILTTSALPTGSVEMDDEELEDDEWMAQFPGLMATQQELLKERGALVSKIRGLPGLENFLLPLPFGTLRSAAVHGPVIIINHCKWRSDIIIILRDSPPSLITTPYNFFGRANRLKDELLGTRQRCGPGSNQYVCALISVLKGLYELVGVPVIERLKELGIPEQSRVWWCPTSVFGYLPLHAMGPIPLAGKEKLYFSDLYISSYTPTLSALITSRDSGARNSNLPNILLVAQPDLSLPRVPGEIQVLQGLDQSLNLPVTNLISQNTTPSAVLDSLSRHQFCHFACGGALATGKPFDASFVLHKELEPLTLLDFVQSRHPAGECAFLATCHTAELPDESLPDEVLHLSAAVQYSGFRSIIGTMWAIPDEDSQHLAKYFYEFMFSDESQEEPYYERSAGALAAAVRMLRRRGAGPERWVGYSHFGA